MSRVQSDIEKLWIAMRERCAGIALTGYHGNEGLRISEALPPSAMASLTTSQQYARVP